MENKSPNFLGQLGTLWSKMNASERLIVGASAIILVFAITIWIGVTRQPAYALLYGGLEPTDAGKIIGELQGKNVPYKIRDNGKSIHVPVDEVDELRITLASGGFSPTGTTGYELFDKTTIGWSDFIQQTRRTQAIEGELSRTLMSLDEVSAARVHLTLPEPTPFIREKTEPMASVVLQLSPPGTALSRENIAAVRTFVAGAIGSLKPDNVTIIDQNMNLLTGPVLNESSGLLPTQEEMRRNYEMERAAAIRALLERPYGLGKVAVSFSCEMDFDQVQTESLTYEPVAGTDHGVVVSEESTESSSKGEGTAAPVGVPGTESNIPSYPGASSQPFETEDSSLTKNFEVSSEHEVRTQAPGTIKSCSVSVLIDSKDRTEEEIGPNEISEVETLVASSAMIDKTRGDTITVSFKPFDTSLNEELATQKASIISRDNLKLGINYGIAIAALIIFFVVLRNFLKPIENGFIFKGVHVEGDEERSGVDLPTGDPEMLEKLRMREEIEKMIRNDPVGAARVIKTWLKE
ncbi:MAG: flagellar basal-body MS-ring/collar protein FliF [bacterium]